MTNTERIEALETRVLALENKLAPPAAKTHFTRISYKEPEPAALEPLTEEEEAFLKARGADIKQKSFILNIQMKAYKKEELEHIKALIRRIKEKRAVQVSWYS